MKRLRELREQKGISQQNLADILNVSQQSIYKYENGLTEPSISILKDIAKYFDTSIDYIVERTDNPSIDHVQIEVYYSQNQIDHIKKYSSLDIESQDLIDKLVDKLK